jgi:hypothetical protein
VLGEERLVRSMDVELVWLAHEHEPWRPPPSKASLSTRTSERRESWDSQVFSQVRTSPEVTSGG